MNKPLLFLTVMLQIASCKKLGPDKAVTSEAKISYENAFPGATFERPVLLAAVPGKDSTYLVLEQSGKIQIVTYGTEAWGKTEFAKVNVTGGESGGDERGLLGFAFHPEFTTNRKYYIYYVLDARDEIAEGVADSSLLKDSGASRRVLLSIQDPYPNHNGGTIAFGPKDHFLYIGAGDGGSAGDPHGNGQNKQSLLGKFLRIDVDHARNGMAYAIPSDNPFAKGGGAPEVWAYGLRNPWKWSFDSATGELWAGDVGQDRIEEVDIIQRGGNYGWNVWEGNRCYPRGGTRCGLPDHKPPIFTYKHEAAGGISITGGIVFRGNPSSPYFGSFLCGDYGTGNMWAVNKSGKAVPLTKLPGIGLSSINADAQGNVYVMGVNSEIIYRMIGL